METFSFLRINNMVGWEEKKTELSFQGAEWRQKAKWQVEKYGGGGLSANQNSLRVVRISLVLFHFVPLKPNQLYRGNGIRSYAWVSLFFYIDTYLWIEMTGWCFLEKSNVLFLEILDDLS